ncbi:MAG: response regulator [Deltaproteobacteria bacterium]|nr:response regulator [Deltaproteobacteria bacterium]
MKTNLKALLLIDDDPHIRQVLAHAVELHGFRVMTAENGAEALHILEQLVDLPGLILVDMMMPVMGGIEFLTLKKQHPRLRAIPTAVLSASSSPPQNGLAELVLEKPFSLLDLLEIVGRYCRPETAAAS